MSDAPAPSLRFDETESTSSATCTACAQPLGLTYFTVNGQVVCPSCRHSVGQVLEHRAGALGLVKSIGFGSAAGALGAILWWAVRRFASLEIGLIAIGIGHFVGIGVRRGSGGRGGPGFQVLAVALTYFWITANYVPDIIQAMASRETARTAATATAGGTNVAAPSGTPAAATAVAPASPADDGPVTAAQFALAIAFIFGIAMAGPFLEGAGNIIGLAIIAFGLFQAWKLNARVALQVDGPFRIAAADTAPDARG